MADRIGRQPDLENLWAYDGQIIEPVKPPQLEIVYYGALHLGKAALNLMSGHSHLNHCEHPDKTHFSENYGFMLAHADHLSRPGSAKNRNFTPADQQDFWLMAGLEPREDFVFPSIVVGLAGELNGQLRRTSSAYELWGRLQSDMIDPVSRRALDDIFGLATELEQPLAEVIDLPLAAEM